MPGEIVRFQDFELDSSACELRQAGGAVRIERIPLDLLFLLVERPGELITRQEILDRIWGKDVFVDADHSINTAVRKLRQALSDDSEAPRFILTVPARGYRFVASITRAAFPPVSELSASVAPRRPMLVVLPFENLSNDSTQEYFSDGLTEETISVLGEVAAEQLGVVARTSAMVYKRSSKGIAEIGRELGVDYAVEGTVRREGDRIRITAQLIRTSDQTHLWARSYDRELKDVLALQAELGRAIAGQVQVKLLPASTSALPEKSPMNQAAYESYLHGRFHLWKVTRPELERAISYFEEATNTDPRMAVAYAGIADCYDVLPITSDARPRDAFPKAEQAAKKALDLDRDLAEAHCALASVRFWFNWDWAASEHHSRLAIARNPSYARAHLRYAHLLSNTGRHDQAIAEIDLARRLDPFSLIINNLCAEFRYHAGRYAEVLPLLQRTLALEPRFWVALVHLAKLYHFEHRLDEALAASQAAVESSAGNTEALSLVGYSFALMGRRSEAEQVLAELESRSKQRFVPPYNLATLHLGLGNKAAALDALDLAFLERDVHLVFLVVEPRWQALSGEPRFQSLLRRVGLRSAES